MLKFKANGNKVDIMYNDKRLKFAEGKNSQNAISFANMMNKRKVLRAKEVNGKIVFYEQE